MKPLFLFLLSLLLALPTRGQAPALPSLNPVMEVTAADGTESEETMYQGSAPITLRLRAQPENLGAWTARYEWRFTREGETAPFLTRYEADTDYTLQSSGTFSIMLFATFTQGAETYEWEQDEAFRISIDASQLEFPNAFTPNGDGINDVLRAKEGYKSIISFKASVYSRWGKRLYEWTDITGGWDGRAGGSDVPDGAYYLVVEAQGADGRAYQIKKVVNLLRGFTEGAGATE